MIDILLFNLLYHCNTLILRDVIYVKPLDGSITILEYFRI